MKYYYHLFLILSLILLSFSVFSQLNTDSLKLIWEDESIEDSVRYEALRENYASVRFDYPEKALQLAQVHLKMAEASNNNAEILTALIRIGMTQGANKHYDEAHEAIDRALRLSRKYENKQKEAIALGDKGTIYRLQINYASALEYYSKSLELSKSINFQFTMQNMLNNLGTVHHIIGDYEVALNYYKECLDLVLKEDSNPSKVRVVKSYLNIASIQQKLNKHDEAIPLINKAISTIESTSNVYFKAACQSTLANSLYEQNKIKEAKEAIEISLSLLTNVNFPDAVLYDQLLLSKINFKTNRSDGFNSALKNLSEVENSTDIKLKTDYYEFLHKCYKSQDNAKEALKMLELYNQYKDSIAQEKDQLAILKETVKLEYESKLHESEIQSEQERYNLKLNQQKKTFIIILVSLILLGLLLLKIRTQNQKNKLVKDELLKEIEHLKNVNNPPSLAAGLDSFMLNRESIETHLKRTLNETDWNVLNILLEKPVLTNKEIGELAFKSAEGISSSLKRMYDYFQIEKTKYMKIALLMKAIKLSKA